MPNHESVRQAWDGLLEADRLHRYYGYLAHKLEATNLRLSLATSILTSGAFLALMTDSDAWEWLPKSMALVAAIASAWLTLNRYSRKAVKSAGLERKFADLMLEWEALWGEVSSSGDDEVRARCRALNMRAVEITDGASVELPDNAGLRGRSQDEAYAYRLAAHCACE